MHEPICTRYFRSIRAARRRVVALVGAVLSVAIFLSPAGAAAQAATGTPSNAIAALVELLVGKGVMTRAEAEAFVQHYAPPADAGPAVAAPPAVVAQEAVAPPPAPPRWPSWVDRLHWGGDARLRYQGDYFDPGNALLGDPSAPDQVLNTTEDRHRARYRLRLTMTAEVNSRTEVGVRLATGNESNPVSTNDTLGDYQTNDGAVVERAYLRWAPSHRVTMWGGRIPNPWFHSDLVWDPDLNFEGLALQLSQPLGGVVNVFATGGVFPLQEVEFSGRDKWLFGGQVGVRLTPSSRVTATLGVAYYDYDNIVGRANDPARPNELDYTAPPFLQKGNTLFNIDPLGAKFALASDFNELNVTGLLDLAFFAPVHVLFLADYVENLGFNQAAVARRTGVADVPKATSGYHVSLSVGHKETRDAGDWRLGLAYKWLEEDAVLDAFTESDFHLGGTNVKGWILAGQLGLGKNVWLRSRWLSGDEIDGPQLAIDVFQVDVNAAF